MIGLALAGAVLAMNWSPNGSPPAATAACASARPAAAESTKPPARPLVVFGGTDSGVRQAGYRRVETDEQWAAVWRDHRGPDGAAHPRPQVDFTRCTVVALFRGATANCEDLSAATVAEAGGAVVVRIEFPGYATGINVEPHAVTPFGFIVLPKTDKPIVLEQDEGSRKAVDQPVVSIWKEVARLAPADK